VLSSIFLVGCVKRSESDVVVYSALDEEFAFPILNGFERRSENQTKIIPKFDVESTKTVGLVNQIIAEKDRPVCDLFWNNEILHTVRLQKLGLLKPRSWNLPANYPPEMVAGDGSWCGFAARARVLIVNTEVIDDPSQYPQSVDELADPKWKGRCAMARPLFGTTATHFAVLQQIRGKKPTLDFLNAIQENSVILSGNKQVATAVASGQLAWGLTDTDDAIVEKDRHAPVAIVFPDQNPNQLGTLRIPNAIAVLKDAPHPVAADLLADYLLEPSTEERLAMGYSSQLPIHPNSKYPPRVLPKESVRWMSVDFESAGDDWVSWSAELKKIFLD
jgi:iron(III) transport system substrate-binding protein